MRKVHKKKRFINPFTLLFIVLTSLLLVFTIWALCHPSAVQDFRYRYLFGEKKPPLTELRPSTIMTEGSRPPTGMENNSESNPGLSGASDDWDHYKLEDIQAGRTDIRMSQALMLINQAYPLDESFQPDIVDFLDTDLKAHRELIDSYRDLATAVMDRFDEPLYVISAYRSHEEQKITYEEMPDVAQVPGSSEHESGLALDVYTFEHAGLAFVDAEPGKWVNENAWKFGFIIRYPMGREDMTGISYEPWHLRYVGLPHSKIITERHWVLDEYSSRLTKGQIYREDGFFFSRQDGPDFTVPKNASDISLSPDNQGSFILTGKVPE